MCVHGLPVSCAPSRSHRSPGAKRLAQSRAEQPSLLPAPTSSPLWGCQAPGRGWAAEQRVSVWS